MNILKAIGWAVFQLIGYIILFLIALIVVICLYRDNDKPRVEITDGKHTNTIQEYK